MKITITTPVSLYEIGKRGNNEDSMFPLMGKATASDRLFLVCDGVGGANKGEVASQMLCQLIPAYFDERGDKEPDQAFMDEMLKDIEELFEAHNSSHPECKGMASTLTLLYFCEQGAFVAWCGDSRVYQFRQGKLQYVTDDHSLVAQLVSRGEITEEEAESHPQKNVILRAISGTENPTKIECHWITDIQEGDRFLSCTDGVLESFNSRELTKLTVPGIMTIEDMRDAILMRCAEKSRDNHAMHLMEIEKVEGSAKARTVHEQAKAAASVNKTEISDTEKLDNTHEASATKNIETQSEKKSALPVLLLVGAALILASILGFIKFKDYQNNQAYQTLIDAGDDLLKNQNYDAALVKFESARDLKEEDRYAKEKIGDIRAYMAEEINRKAIEDSIRNLDTITTNLADTLTTDTLQLEE